MLKRGEMIHQVKTDTIVRGIVIVLDLVSNLAKNVVYSQIFYYKSLRCHHGTKIDT